MKTRQKKNVNSNGQQMLGGKSLGGCCQYSILAIKLRLINHGP